MKNILTLTLLLLCVFSTAAMAQTSTSTSQIRHESRASNEARFSVPNKDQINQAQAILKERGFLRGNKSESLMMQRGGTAEVSTGGRTQGDRNAQQDHLEKMNITLTDKQKTM
jgi:cell division protein YceG involved in septum cleavage